MDRISQISWLEQWAGRYGLHLEPLTRLRPGEVRSGIFPMARPGQFIPEQALQELINQAEQLTFTEFGEPPPVGGALQGRPGGGSGEGQSPDSITGGRVTLEPFRGFEVGQGLCAGVDQFTVVGKGEEARAKMLASVEKYLGQAEPRLWGINRYREAVQWESGAILTWTEGREDWCLHVTGRTLQLVGQDRHLQFMLDVNAHADHATRVDLRLDDYSKRLIDLDRVKEATQAGNFTIVRKCQINEPMRWKRGVLVPEGRQIVFGSRDSARVSFYDKDLESRGQIAANRLEVQFGNEKSRFVWPAVVTAAAQGPQALARKIGELVCGAIDFRERAQHRHTARMQQLPWWTKIVNALGAIRVKVEKVTSTLNASMAAMVSQYGKKIARAFVVMEAMGQDALGQFERFVQSCRAGLELEDRALSPLEAAFNPVGVFRIPRRGRPCSA